MSTLDLARSLDQSDDLKSFRDRFLLPDHGGKQSVYFLGNSLGMQPRTASTHIREVLDDWSSQGVESFFKGKDPWIDYHDHIAPSLARVVGARPSEIVVMNSLTVNLHLMLVSFYRPIGKRCKILCEHKAFPSDQYLLETHVRQRGLDPKEVIIEVMPREGNDIIDEADIQYAINHYHEELALILFSGVQYYTGQCFDIKGITAAGHSVGAMVGFDLAHAAGNVPLQLHEWEVDFACWCNYKYLNAGPGAVGGVFIHQRHHLSTENRFAGWWGYDKKSRFAMQPGFIPVPSAEGWQISTPPILLYATLRASLEIFDEAEMERLHKKRERLTDYLWQILNEVLHHTGSEQFRIITPDMPRQRGCQVSLLFKKKGRLVFDHLTHEGFFVDWREPDVIRLAPVPLYNTFEEVFRFGEVLKAAVK